MDPLSITSTCIGLASTITRTSLVVIGFVKDVRAARSDLDTVSRELLSVKTVLELLADHVNESTNHSIPQTLQKQIVGIVTNCTSVVVDIEETLKKHDGGKLNKAAKWVASGKNDVAKLQSSLEAHKSALEIALDMVTLTLAREIKADTQEILNDASAIKQDNAQILAEIAQLQEQLPQGENRRSAGFMLERYLDNLTSYAETKKKILQKRQEVSRELGVVREARQKLRMTDWGKDVARQKQPQNDKQTAIKPQKFNIRLARAHKMSILIEHRRALEFYVQMVEAEVAQSLAHVIGENAKGRKKSSPSKTHGSRSREKKDGRTIIARFGRGSKIVEWDPSDSFDIPNYCKK